MIVLKKRFPYTKSGLNVDFIIIISSNNKLCTRGYCTTDIT
ncbi:hypothetical protein [Bacillus sp. SA1-12]|nr:hypothetical protein [Bacillus sp. SA1-12]